MALLLLDKEGKEKAKKVQKQYKDYQKGLADPVKPEDDDVPEDFDDEAPEDAEEIRRINNVMQARLDAINLQLDSMFEEIKKLMNESIELSETLGY
jgi:uncharacterized coiled-coil DUF342 family protein